MAKWLIVVGLIILGIGLILHFAPGLLKWFGHLPGDLHFRGERSQVFIPIYIHDSGEP